MLLMQAILLSHFLNFQLVYEAKLNQIYKIMRFIITSSDAHVTAVALIYTLLLSFVPSLKNSLYVFIIYACIGVHCVCV